MIALTRLGGQPFVLNADLIRYIEACPDTFITLTTGERLVVAEPMDEVVARAVRYQQLKQIAPTAPRKLQGTGTTAASAAPDARAATSLP